MTSPSSEADRAKEPSPYRVGDKVRLKPNAPGSDWQKGATGVVEQPDVLVARAYEMGWDSCGIIGVRYPDNRLETTHRSNYERVED